MDTPRFLLFLQVRLDSEALRLYDELNADFAASGHGRSGSVSGISDISGMGGNSGMGGGGGAAEAKAKALSVDVPVGENGLPFDEFTFLLPGQDGGQLLTMDEAQCRKRIRESELPVIDFRQYLFSRQWHMLMSLAGAREEEALSRGISFIRSMVEDVAKHAREAGLPPQIGAAWAYAACMALAAAFRQHESGGEGGEERGNINGGGGDVERHNGTTEATGAPVAAAGTAAGGQHRSAICCRLGDVLQIARGLLLEVGEAALGPQTWAGRRAQLWLPDGGFISGYTARGGDAKEGEEDADGGEGGTGGSDASSEASLLLNVKRREAVAAALRPFIVNEDLIAAIGSVDALQERYISVTRHASMWYRASHRDRFRVSLDSSRAAIHMHRGEFSAAAPLLLDQCACYAEDGGGWSALHLPALTALARCERVRGLQEPAYGYASFVRWGIRLLEVIAEIVGDLDQWKYVEQCENKKCMMNELHGSIWRGDV